MRKRWWVAAILTILLSPVLSFGITDEEVFRDFRFNFINPGGRSLGMGGAFISIADDATSAQANPAGLTNLLSPQFFMEIRYAKTDTTTTERTFIDPFSNPGEPNGFREFVRTNPESSTSPSFFSLVYPWRQVWFAVSRQEVLNIQNHTINEHEFLFGTASDLRRGRGDIELRLVNWNLSGAWRLHDRFRLGATVSYGLMTMRSSVVNTYEDPSGTLIGDPSFQGVPFEMYETQSDDSDSDITYTAGFLWQIVSSVSVGGVFRAGGDFTLKETLTAQNIDPSLVPGRIASRVFFNESGTLLTPSGEDFVFTNEFHVPDVYGLGASWRPTEKLTLAADVVRIAWSGLEKDFNSRLNVLTVGWETEQEASFTVDDQTNYHLGSEYVLGRWKTVDWTLRSGFHTEKDSRIRADFANGEDGFGLANNDNFPAGKDENHYSLGLGVVLKNQFQIDVAADASSHTFELVTSMTYQF